MASERRYGEDEVKEILDRAVQSEATTLPGAKGPGGATGLTLAQLQEVGREIGVEPSRIAEAALAVDSAGQALPRRITLGMPVGVGREVALPRPMTDQEWEILLGDVRATFGARGYLRAQGAVREWRNGNLFVALEPTAYGHRLRMGTRKASAAQTIAIGAGAVLAGLAMVTTFLATGASPVQVELLALMMIGGGGGMLAINRFTLPAWAREREAQMEYLAGRVHAMLGAPPHD